MKTEFKEKFLTIPFGLLSGFSTCCSSALALSVFLFLKILKLNFLSLNSLLLVYALSLTLANILFNFQLQKKTDQIQKEFYPKSTDSMSANVANKGIEQLIFDFLPELLLVRSACSIGVNPLIALSFLAGAKMIGGPLLGWMTHIGFFKTSFAIASLTSFITLLLLTFPSQFGLSLTQTTVCGVLLLKGLFGSVSSVMRGNTNLYSRKFE